MIGQDMLQKEVKAVAMVLMAQMTEFMQKDIVLKHTRQAHDGEIKVYIPL